MHSVDRGGRHTLFCSGRTIAPVMSCTPETNAPSAPLVRCFISNLVEHAARSTGVRFPSALVAPERGRPTLVGQQRARCPRSRDGSHRCMRARRPHTQAGATPAHPVAPVTQAPSVSGSCWIAGWRNDLFYQRRNMSREADAAVLLMTIRPAHATGFSIDAPFDAVLAALPSERVVL
jgi:hypothetical protein